MIEHTEPQHAAPQWTFGQFILLVVFWFAGAVVGVIVALASGADVENLTVRELYIAIIGQSVGVLAYLYYLSTRYGSSNWALDFGLRLAPFKFGALFLGVGLQIVLGVLTFLFVPEDALEQGITEDIAAASGLGTRLLVGLVTAALVPIIEELMFRGVLLSRLYRSMPAALAIVVSALIFAAAHLTDANLWVLPGLIIVGVVLAWVAIRDGDLSRAIPIHIGFNLIGVLALFAGVG